MKKIISFILVIMISMSIVGCGGKGEEANKDTSKEEVSKKEISLTDLKAMPQFELEDMEGNKVTNEVFKDYDITMVNIWATWWGACVDEMPELQALYSDMKDKKVNVIGILDSRKLDKNTALDILKESDVQFTNLIADEKFTKDFMSKVRYFPTSIFVNNKGEIVGKVVVGSKGVEGFKEIIEELLNKEQ